MALYWGAQYISKSMHVLTLPCPNTTLTTTSGTTFAVCQLCRFLLHMCSLRLTSLHKKGLLSKWLHKYLSKTFSSYQVNILDVFPDWMEMLEAELMENRLFRTHLCDGISTDSFTRIAERHQEKNSSSLKCPSYRQRFHLVWE